jgi:hypothetical protein
VGSEEHVVVASTVKGSHTLDLDSESVESAAAGSCGGACRSAAGDRAGRDGRGMRQLSYDPEIRSIMDFHFVQRK